MEREKSDSIDDVYDTYMETQKQLWDRWMRIAWRFEVSSTPENAWWAIPYRAMSRPEDPVNDEAPVEEAWLQMWRQSMRQREGVFGALIEWNRRILEQQAKANAEFLNAWSEAMHRVGGDAWDASTAREFRALNAAIRQAISRPSDADAITAAGRAETRRASATRRAEAESADRRDLQRPTYTE